MNKIILLALGCFLFLIINGCAVRTYTIIQDRVDQDLSKGNRGYFVGGPEVSEEKPRKTTRQIQILEVELPQPKVAAKIKTSVPKPAISVKEGSEGAEEITVIKPLDASPDESSQAVVMEKYTVLKGDTMQSISKKFYGITRRWKEIYDANQEILKSPEKIYPGQIIEIPVEEVVETE